MATKPKQRIVFSSGFWCYHDPARNFIVRLDPMFAECGWKVGPLCESLGVARRTFARVIEESLGITGKVWLRQMRAVAACHLLREGGKIKSLAQRLGFFDDSDFTREFKKVVGVSPSSYMKAEESRSYWSNPSSVG